jgi:hypothetical protein
LRILGGSGWRATLGLITTDSFVLRVLAGGSALSLRPRRHGGYQQNAQYQTQVHKGAPSAMLRDEQVCGSDANNTLRPGRQCEGLLSKPGNC